MRRVLYFYCLQVSLVPNRTLEKEVETTAQILLSLLRTKRPVVLVTTNNVEGNEIFVREAERLINRKGRFFCFVFRGVKLTKLLCQEGAERFINRKGITLFWCANFWVGHNISLSRGSSTEKVSHLFFIKKI